MERFISILGSTGSIGTQTLDVIRNIKGFTVSALSANFNVELLLKQIVEFKPAKIAVTDYNSFLKVKEQVASLDFSVEVLFGMDGLCEIATLSEVDTVVTALVGSIGLIPTLAAIHAKKNIALANKETLVTAGSIVMKAAKENNVSILPVDSEHSAIFQCLQGNFENKISKILLTASGGPFRNFTKEQLQQVTVSDALKHPNWAMGKKITIDSATMMNKGLEVIEAKWLFDVELNDIEVLVHPQSVVHSMVEFTDGSVMAQLGEHDMRVPIQYALTYPKRVENNYPKIDFFVKNNLTFDKPKLDLFPCLSLAFSASEIGGTMPCVLNAANEVLVAKFLNSEITFLDIPRLIEKTMSAYTVKYDFNIEDLLSAESWVKSFLKDYFER